ncbi:MAG TPA: hypothetical protein VND83_09650 [Acidimicrobiales bacterium]|nr:hypothetical protein [Acidimicrobiales bacterium]
MATTTKKAPAKKSAKRTMTADHKAKLAQGRNESRAVSKYLDALSAGKGKRGRKRTPESISMVIVRLDKELPDATPIRRLELTQKRYDLVAERERLLTRVDLSGLEKDFVKVARSYAQRNGIGYGAFRELGVSAEVLKRAGIGRTRG